MDKFFKDIEDSIIKLTKGAFLIVKNNNDKSNIMTIGWAMVGILFRKPTLMVAVKPSRYTFSLIENADDFTVSIPFRDMTKELSYCGSKSGKNLDKFKECNLSILPAQKTISPIIDISGRFYECKIIQITNVDSSRLSFNIDKEIYSDKSYHNLYFGEILSVYERK